MVVDVLDPLIVPVGQFLGEIVLPPGDGVQQVLATIRLADTVITPDPAGLRVWRLAHTPAHFGAAADRSGAARGHSAETLAAAAERAGIGQAESVIDSLIDDGLLAELDLDDSSVVDFARAIRLCPLLLMRGNDPAEPGRFWIGTNERQVVSVPFLIGRVYAWSPQCATLFDACERVAAQAAGVPALASSATAESLVSDVVVDGHLLLVAGAAYFDRGLRRTT